MQAKLKIFEGADDAQMAGLLQLKSQRQDLSDRAAGLIAARNHLAEAEEAERAAVAAVGEFGKRGEIAAMTEWASNGAAGDPPAPVDGAVDGDGLRLIAVYKKATVFCNQNGQQIKLNGGRSRR